MLDAEAESAGLALALAADVAGADAIAAYMAVESGRAGRTGEDAPGVAAVRCSSSKAI